MQLPRGKFRSIKKGVLLGDILDDMATSRFSGTCSFSSDTVTGTVVFKAGAIILAKVQAQYGDPAIDEARLMREQPIDAVLSDFDGTQIQLALDFNKHAHVRNGGIWQGGSLRKETSSSPQGSLKKHEPGHRTVPEEKDFIKIPTVAPAGAPVPAKLDKNLTADNSSDTQEEIRQEQTTPQGPPLTSAEKEFETFDSMDLEDVTQKIRRDSKIILKQLELDHLMEK